MDSTIKKLQIRQSYLHGAVEDISDSVENSNLTPYDAVVSYIKELEKEINHWRNFLYNSK